MYEPLKTSRRNGGPAFGHGNPEQGGDPGMSLRDWFAGQAMTALVRSRGASDPAITAEDAYIIADNMLEERL